MECPKCGYDNQSGQYCQNCGEPYRLPKWVAVLSVVNLLLLWVLGLVCIATATVCKSYLKRGDLVEYQKWLGGFKVVGTVGVVLGVLLNAVLLYVGYSI